VHVRRDDEPAKHPVHPGGQSDVAVVGIINQMALQYYTAIIVVTHDEKIISTFKRVHHIRDGSTHEEAGEGRSL
jgi:putative ABC transport system ATP-binding protein